MEAKKLPQPESEPFQLSLRIRHPSIDPEEISSALKMEPEHSFKVGTPRASHSGSTTTRHSESYWLGALEPSAWLSRTPALDIHVHGHGPAAGMGERGRAMASNVLELALGLFTNLFLRQHAAFMRRMQSEGGQVCLLVQISPTSVRGFTLSPQTARTLGELGVTVEFEVGNA
jgi:hypothetical protein